MELEFPKAIVERLREEGTFVITKVNHETITSLTNWMMKGVCEGRSNFTLLINSPGGSAGIVTYFSAMLKTFPGDTHLTGVAVGECGSAAFALFQCCHTRLAVRNTAFFLHRVRYDLKIDLLNTTPKILNTELESLKTVEDEVVAIQCKRIGITTDAWYEIANIGEKIGGASFFADKALELGMVDEVIDQYNIFQAKN